MNFESCPIELKNGLVNHLIKNCLSIPLAAFCTFVYVVFFHLTVGFLYANSDTTDATVRACIVASADRWWAIGDRGQVLLTEDAGRRWEPATVDGTSHFYAGIAIDSRKGVLVGGSIQPYSHRSVGTVHVTQDGGRLWRAIDSTDLPRLTGIQSLSAQNWIAWGDWSPAYSSAMFETHDAGQTWTGKSLAASHVQTSAWETSNRGIVVDRLSRVFRIEDGKNPKLLNIGGDPSNPILKAKFDESGWWLIGESAQIYHSLDGHHWQSKSIPGNAIDHKLIRLNDIVFQKMSPKADNSGSPAASNIPRARCWVAGSPGSVIWMSDDLGTSWKIQLTSQNMPIQSIAHAGDATLFAGGKLGTLIGTRNAGEGWWILDREGERVAVLSIAALQETVPWDALTVSARETRAHAASLVLHSQRTFQLAGPWCENATRASLVASELGFAGVDTFSHAPIVSRSDNRTPSELLVYDSRSLDNSNAATHIQKIVSYIRQYRPDVIICDSVDDQDPLVQQAGRAVMTARNRASDSRYSCFSRESGIPDAVWDSKTLLARSKSELNSNRRRSELRFSSTTPIQNEGTLLSDLLMPVSGMVETEDVRVLHQDFYVRASDSMLPWDAYGEYSLLQGPRPSGGKSGLLPDAIRQIGSMRPKVPKDSVAYRELIVNLQRESMIKKIVEIEVEEATNDSRWKTALQGAMRTVAREARSQTLWHIAQEARLRSQWNRWMICLDVLIGEYSSEGVAELAVLQRSAWSNSAEVNLWRQQQENLKSSQTTNSSVISASFVTTSSSSPFEHTSVTERPNSDIGHAVHESRQPSRSTLQGQPASKIVSPVRTVAAEELVGMKGKEPALRADASTFAGVVSIAHQKMETDPRMVLLGLRRRLDLLQEGASATSAGTTATLPLNSHRTTSNASQIAALKNTLKQMSEWYGLYGWSSLADDEITSRLSNTNSYDTASKSRVASDEGTIPNSLRIPHLHQRPILDGSLDDGVWQQAQQIQLSSTWINRDQAGKPTAVFLAHDGRFLYLSGICSTDKAKLKVETESMESGEVRRHDDPLRGADRVSIRIDTDRDFLTWFQFNIDSDGNLEDSLNDMKSWNPRWYATSKRMASGWTFEIAIPLGELIDSREVGLLADETSFAPSPNQKPGGPPAVHQNPLAKNLVVWNIAVERESPGKSLEQLKPLFIEDFSPASWRYVLVERASEMKR